MSDESRETVVLDAETLAAVDDGLKSEKAEPQVTLGEAVVFARAKMDEWERLRKGDKSA